MLTISAEKSKFCMSELCYRGHVVSTSGNLPNQEKVSAIVDFPVPKSIKEVRRSL